MKMQKKVGGREGVWSGEGRGGWVDECDPRIEVVVEIQKNKSEGSGRGEEVVGVGIGVGGL